VPWREIEEILSPLFSDRETIETIMETPMLQYFLGMDDDMMEEIFDYTLLCKYRQRVSLDTTKEMSDILLKKHKVGGYAIDNEETTHKGTNQLTRLSSS
jgi:hypothetical protein